MCKSWCELIIAIVVIIFALWQTDYSQWILVIAGIALAIHSFTCKKCFTKEMAVAKKKR
ncbi:MAG: hypothetical protein AABX73_00885 [Nanoarchaeota archaeon]